MSTRKKTADDPAPANGDLTAILASIGLTKKPNFKDWQDEDAHRIHWAIRILKYAGFETAHSYDFNYYICGPFDQALQDDLEAIQWARVKVAPRFDDESICTVREAIAMGDDFLLALSLAVGMAERNPGASKAEIAGAIPVLIPDLKAVAAAACDFAEARIWSK